METALTDKQDMFPAPEASQDGMLQDQSQKRKSFDPEISMYDEERPSKIPRTMETSDEPRLSAKTLGVTMVTIYVGEENVEYSVHENLLYLASSFFEDHFQSLQHQSLVLTELDTTTFEMFLAWLYSGTIDYEVNPDGMAHARRAQLAQLARVYYFAQILKCTHLKDVTFGIIRLGTDGINGEIFDSNFVQEIYENTPPGCRLRTWCAILWVRCMRNCPKAASPEVQRLMAEACRTQPDFASDIFAALTESAIKERDRMRDVGDVSFFDTLPLGEK